MPVALLYGMMSLGRQVVGGWLLVALLSGCGSDKPVTAGNAGSNSAGSSSSGGDTGGSSQALGADPSAIPVVPSTADPGTKVVLSAPTEVGELKVQLDAARQATPDELRTQHAVEFQAELGYDPLAAANLDPIFKAWGVDANHPMRAKLAQNGFALQADRNVPSFAYGYSEIYAADLPVFVSADMVLEAIFRSHDKILQALEKQALKPRLARVLDSMRTELVERSSAFEPEVASDLNFFFGVALSLLNGHVDRRESADVKSYYDDAVNAAGEKERILFGVQRLMDFSQFKPRGHYDGDPDLERYFRAMIWLGRTDFRLIETLGDGQQVLRRRQVESVVALRQLLDSKAYADYLAIDRAVSAFVGEHDYMTLQQVDELLAALDSPSGVAGVDDEALASAIVAGGFGAQRVASQVMRRSPGSDTFPLSMSFALFGQRYTVDSHVFSNLVYDRLPTRVVPNPLDVGFAALGNDQALGLLGDELDNQERFAGELSGMRFLVDQHPAEYWESSLYTNWMSALRTLSPTATPAEDLPAVARTENWGRRLLNTQLSSWAQLRHNNVLYVKQSYTSGAACEYPDAYVDPYPDFFKAVVRFAERAQGLLGDLAIEGDLGKKAQDYFARVARINQTLAEMAELQRTGMPHSAEHMAFINQAVTTGINCDGTVLGHTGWYSELHFDALQAVEANPVITDVHTDVGGELPVPRGASVLHVATGLPRMMVLTVDSCSGPRAYAGIVSSYQEKLQDGLVRWTDAEWKQEAYNAQPVVPWLEPVFGK